MAPNAETHEKMDLPGELLDLLSTSSKRASHAVWWPSNLEACESDPGVIDPDMSKVVMKAEGGEECKRLMAARLAKSGLYNLSQ